MSKSPEPYSRPHDPRLCDYLMVEERVEKGEGVVRSVQLYLDVPDASEDFDGGDTIHSTMVGLPLLPDRRPALPTLVPPPLPEPVCKVCGAPYVDHLTPDDQIPDICCDGRCELDVEI